MTKIAVVITTIMIFVASMARRASQRSTKTAMNGPSNPTGAISNNDTTLVQNVDWVICQDNHPIPIFNIQMPSRDRVFVRK